jgi:hypothetical protein
LANRNLTSGLQDILNKNENGQIQTFNFAFFYCPYVVFNDNNKYVFCMRLAQGILWMPSFLALFARDDASKGSVAVCAKRMGTYLRISATLKLILKNETRRERGDKQKGNPWIRFSLKSFEKGFPKIWKNLRCWLVLFVGY